MSLPECFDKGLLFGDPDQIYYIRQQQEITQHEEDMKVEGKKRYRVYVTVDGTYEQDVWAKSEDDAIAEVKKDFDINDISFNVDYDCETVW